MNDTEERVFVLKGSHGAPSLLVRRRPNAGPPVLYVHGATFPSALSFAYRIDGRSWMDDLQANGFDAWAFDFAGYGGSDRYPAMNGSDMGLPLGRAPDAAAQIASVIAFICDATGKSKLSLVAHSWGSMPAGLCATRMPDRLAALCLFGPIVWRNASGLSATDARAWRFVTIAEQRASFYDGLPQGHAPVLFEPELAHWAPAYLATDRDSYSRSPPAVKVPGGPFADTRAAWSGNLAYEPRRIQTPTLVVRGEWDTVCNDADAQWLLARIAHPLRRDAKIPKGTHRMHLERSREGLFLAVREFLSTIA